jgi:tetratricopeptide (TPR) repeat protein
MTIRGPLFIVLCFLTLQAVYAQETTVFTEANLAYKRGLAFYDQGVFGLAQKEFKTATELTRPVNEPEWEELKMQSALYYAKCAVRLEQPDAEVLVVDLLRQEAPAPVAGQAALEIGDYYFNKKEYKTALTYYEMAPNAAGAARDELAFKKGYSHFYTQNFRVARQWFASIKDNARGTWYFPANYYYGCCMFAEKRYDEAATAFSRCESSNQYGKLIPYYLCQIYFARKQYDLVISYGAPKAKDNALKDREKLNQLVGKAYFEKKDFKSALPYLEFAAKNGAPLTPGDYYQLGYAQYQNGFYKQAIDNFEQLTKQDSLLGQNGLYHLGDCYLRTNNKFAARTAFGQAADLNLDLSVRDDALFNYAKLSYELKYDRDALNALQQIQPNSPNYAAAQSLMSDIFLNTRDYDRAIATLESVKNRNAKLDATLQQVCYLRGLQLYQNNAKDQARQLFNRALDFPLDKRTAALCSYWLGVIAHENKEYVISKGHISAFLSHASAYRDLPEESSVMMGQYVQGYNFIKLDDYTGALTNFKSAVDGLTRNRSMIKSEQIGRSVLGDATLRAGDCHFKRNQYREALEYYNNAINQRFEGFEYAMYQKAIIRGLQGVPLDKILGMEELVSRFPQSQYADEALFQIGITYQEIERLDQAVPPLRRLATDFRGRSALVNQALLRLGLIAYNKGNLKDAAEYYKQVFFNNPENQESKDALDALQEIYVKDLNRPDEYFSFLETIPGQKLSGDSRDSLTYASAEIQYNNSRFAQAVDGFTAYLGKYSNGRYVVPAYYYRAESYSSEAVNRYDLAVKDYAAVVNRGPGKFYAKSAEKAAYIANNLKDYNLALEMARRWEEAAGSDNSRLAAQIMAMETAYALRNPQIVNDYARRILNSRLASNEQLARAHYYVGKTAFDQGNDPAATAAFRSVTQLSTADIMAESYHLLGQILFRQRRYAEAESFITEANKASAGYNDWIARNLILLSDVFLAVGDKNSASAALEAVIENYRGNDPEILTIARQKYNQIRGGNARPPGSKGVDNFLILDDKGN